MADDQGFPTAHTTRTATSTVVVTRPYFDISYLYTIPGILKVVEAVLDFICFLCIVVGPNPGESEASWGQFVAIVSFVVTVLLLGMYLLHTIEMLHFVPWLLVEMIYCAMWSFFYFIAGCCMAALTGRYSFHWGRIYPNVGAWGAAAFFCFVLAVIYGIDAFLKFTGWRRGDAAQTGGVNMTTTQTTTSTREYSPPSGSQWQQRGP